MTSKSKQSYWTCTLKGCKAKATMKPDGWFSLTKYTHNHEPNYEEMQKKVIISELRKLSLETELTPAEMLKQVGVTDDSQKKFRDAISFWRWRAKRKNELESPGFYEEHQNEQDGRCINDSDYKFVKIDQSHFLRHRNYLYRKYMSSKTDSGSFWRCRREDCPARIKLDSSALLSFISFNHNHPEEEFEGEDMEQDVKRIVREMAINTDLPIGDILKLHNLEEDVELKKYLKNVRCRKLRNMRGKKQKGEESVINQIELLENVPPGVFVKISKDLLCEISELPINQEGEIEYPQGTIVKVDDQSMVQVINFDPDNEAFDGELLFKNDNDDGVQAAESGEEVLYETVNVSDYTTYVITSDKESEIQPEFTEQVQIEHIPAKYEEITMEQTLAEK